MVERLAVALDEVAEIWHDEGAKEILELDYVRTSGLKQARVGIRNAMKGLANVAESEDLRWSSAWHRLRWQHSAGRGQILAIYRGAA